MEKRLKDWKDKYVSLEYVRNDAQLCEIDEAEFETVIQFFHDRHVVIHFDTPQLNNLVVLDHRWLINIFKEVITVKAWKEQEGFAKHWKKLEEEGILHRELVQHVWKKLYPILDEETIDQLLSLLEQFGLACRLTQPDNSEV